MSGFSKGLTNIQWNTTLQTNIQINTIKPTRVRYFLLQWLESDSEMI